MVARGDLGVEIPPEHVPLIQKRINRMANLHGKPVIIATEMLQSMIENARPTRAEVSDVANAVYDHTDAIMLSNESAVGKYPVQATQVLSKVAMTVENELKKHQKYRQNNLFNEDLPLSYATCSTAARLATDIQAKIILASTASGFTAEQIAKHRIYIPIVVITEDPKVMNQLQLVWGINHVYCVKIDQKNHLKQYKKLLIKEKLVSRGDEVVIVTNASQEVKHISTIVI
jgi:pyruvate kinase